MCDLANTVFADALGASKIMVHVNDDEMDQIPVYEEVFSSDEEGTDDEDDDRGKIYFKISENSKKNFIKATTLNEPVGDRTKRIDGNNANKQWSSMKRILTLAPALPLFFLVNS